MTYRTCTVEGCNNLYKAGGLCGMHYLRRKRTGSAGAAAPERPASTKPQKMCSVLHCDRPSVTKGMCPAHYQRSKATTGPEVMAPMNRRMRGRQYIDSNGYVTVQQPGHEAAMASGRVYVHRAVMAEVLGRPLLPNENVHHKNGNRADNRPENLELWVVSQPAGQRVEDLVAWARGVLAEYEPVMDRLAERHVIQ